MSCRTLAAFAILSTLAACGGGAPGEDGLFQRIERVDAGAYVDSLLSNETYKPRRDMHELSGVGARDPFWRKSIFNGRRVRAARDTGLQLPDLSSEEAEQQPESAPATDTPEAAAATPAEN